jgi:hypothetical protein
LRGDRSHINGWPRLHRRETRTDRQRYRQTDESDPSGSRPLFFILLKLKSREREKKDYFSSFTLFTVKLTCLNKTWVSA